MKTQAITITNKLGLHARAAAKLVTLSNTFQADIRLRRDQKVIDTKNIMSVLLLAASQGTELEVTADGQDEEEAVKAIVDLINQRFGEPE